MERRALNGGFRPRTADRLNGADSVDLHDAFSQKIAAERLSREENYSNIQCSLAFAVLHFSDTQICSIYPFAHNVPSLDFKRDVSSPSKHIICLTRSKRNGEKQNKSRNANMLTELLQLFELKDFLLPFLVSWAEVQGRAFQHKPAQPPVVQVMALFVVQSANQLAVPLHQSLDFWRDEALRVTRVK